MKLLSFAGGSHNGFPGDNGQELVNIPVDAVAGGHTIKVAEVVPGGTTTLCFTNDILRALQ